MKGFAYMKKLIHTKAFNFFLGLIGMGILLGTFYLLFVRGNLNDSSLSELQRTELFWSVPWMAGSLLLLWFLSFGAINDEKFTWCKGETTRFSIYGLFIIFIWILGMDNRMYLAFKDSFLLLHQAVPLSFSLYQSFEFFTYLYGIFITFLIQRKILWDKKQLARYQLPQGAGYDGE